MKVKSFYRKWIEIRETISKKDLDLFYKVVDIDGHIGRVISFDMKDGHNYNPNYLVHWFPRCRCHWNVILPLWLLNKKQLNGKYAVITNDKHSAIINTETKEIYDPTYTASRIDLNTTLEMFKDYEIMTITGHIARIDDHTILRFIDFLSNKNKNLVQEELQNLIEKHQSA